MIVRTADAEDVGAVREFLTRLSPETGFRRFFTGLGGALIVRAGEDAVAAGARVLRFAVLGENRRVVSWLTRLWPGLTPTREDGMVVYEVAVDAQVTEAPAA